VQGAVWKGRKWQKGKMIPRDRREYDFKGNLQSMAPKVARESGAWGSERL